MPFIKTTDCAECSEPIYESFGTTKAGDLLECMQGTRNGKDVRALCPMCGTFYANVRLSWLRPSWRRIPIPMWKVCRLISRVFGIAFFNPVV